MYNTDLPTRAELPSTGKLLRSTAIAALVSVALLITTVLPAEYGIDPTGIGRSRGVDPDGRHQDFACRRGNGRRDAARKSH